MRITFHDRQDRNNPADGQTVESLEQIETLFNEVRRREPSFVELVGPEAKLLVGLAGDEACVQHSPANGEPPYYVALNEERLSSLEEVTFLMSDSATPIPRRYCIPFARLLPIVESFLRTGERSTTADWAE